MVNFSHRQIHSPGRVLTTYDSYKGWEIGEGKGEVAGNGGGGGWVS